MDGAEKSLRAMVEHWLVGDRKKLVRVTRFGSRRPDQGRYVCVEAYRTGEQVAMFFFRHQDRTWRIYPPTQDRPAMRLPLCF